MRFADASFECGLCIDLVFRQKLTDLSVGKGYISWKKSRCGGCRMSSADSTWKQKRKKGAIRKPWIIKFSTLNHALDIFLITTANLGCLTRRAGQSDKAVATATEHLAGIVPICYNSPHPPSSGIIFCSRGREDRDFHTVRACKIFIHHVINQPPALFVQRREEWGCCFMKSLHTN